ncbi:MAG: ABC transporter ATP-binding protein/permease [Candidatus Aminicenantes bacterium]|nr:ABC transporter ATP-binding protein/permease [Candidatus Aminicenantes bacterium]
MREIFNLIKLVWQEKRYLLFAFICSLFVAAFTYLFVNLVQPIIDELLISSGEKTALTSNPSAEKFRLMNFILSHFQVSKQELIWFLPILLLTVVFGKGLFTFLSSYLMKVAGHRVIKKLRDDLFGHVMRQSASFFDRLSTGDLMTRLTNDIDKIHQAISGSLADFIEEVFVLLALLVGVFIIDFRLAMASLVITPLAIIPLAIFSRQLKRKSLVGQKKMSQIYNLIHETITGNKIIKAFTAEEFELRRFFGATKDYFKTMVKLAWIGSLSSPFMEFIGGAVGAFILFVGTRRIAEGFISAGDFGAFVLAIFMMYTPISRLNRANNVLQQAVACYSRVKEILEMPPQIKDHPEAVSLDRVEGHICFENVSFSYNQDRPALVQVSFEVKPKETVAIVGLSGAGKTTIINLLTRLYEPSSGKIMIDGLDIKKVKLASLRRHIGLVTQDIILFNDTVRNNIAYGQNDVPFERIIEAARMAMAHDFIMALPQGYDTIIGEKGGLLSSGQRQRIALARAILKEPAVLILDEATSALDSESERLIQLALSNIIKERTTIIIAHRIWTVRHADRILVVDRGRIVEMGNHEELYALNGIYRKLYDLQFPEETEVEV